MAISGIVLSFFSNYAMKEVLGVSTRSYYICRVLWVFFFLVSCKGKFLITYIFHDVS